ncbi:magnesium transporter [Granulicatella balaenopterae]|uniref:Magnesium transporter MgtE n=1 Tax=Granulicatella balaenopterae TaxID=137733 RepID=A0A1H9LYS9_9LACT|nr:magnesium transporter [Granulicatella balaenopterae]SER16385.1 magnesium transporter [Granulicatella balaenopterae]
MKKNAYLKLLEYVKSNNIKEFRNIIFNMNEIDIAILINDLDLEIAVVFFRMLPKEISVNVFSHLDIEKQKIIIDAISNKEINNIIEKLYTDDAVDLIEELPANVVKRVLDNASNETRNIINEYLKYPENSAGSIMTSEYIGLKKDMTVKESFSYIRKYGENKETLYMCYVMDNTRNLLGVVSLQTLIMNDDKININDIMDTNIIQVNTEDSKETVINIFNKYKLLTLPVVDKENRLVGIITADDIVDVAEEEVTEDFEKMAAMLPSENSYLKTSIFELSKNRIPWLMVLMISSMLTGSILSKYEEAFSVLPLLVTFIPMLTDTGGNAGSQSSTMIIRGIALGEIKNSDWIKVLFKEFGVSIICGFALGVVNFLRLMLQYPGQKLLVLTVVLSLFVTVIIAKVIGGLLPIGAKLLKLDPAIMAAPLITTIVDALSLIIYFYIAMNLLQLS